jgi:hypothetical protein
MSANTLVKTIKPGSIYVNVDINNNDNSDGLNAQISVNLSQNLLDHACEYDVSVVRMKYPNSQIPLSLRFLDADYSLSMSLGNSVDLSYGVYFTNNLINEDITNGDDRFLLSYNDWVVCINSALQRNWNAMGDLLSVYGWLVPDPETGLPIPRTTVFTDMAAPYIAYDVNNKLFSIYLDKFGFNEDISDPLNYGFRFWMNKSFNAIFAFDTAYTGQSDNSPFDTPVGTVPIRINDFILSTQQVFDTDPLLPDYNIFRQTFRSLSNLSSLESVIVTTSLPINPEVLVTNYNGTASAGTNGGFDFRSILTDFEVSTSETGRDLSGYDYYAAAGYQRRYTMSGIEPIRNINLQLYWKTTTGQYYPLVIGLYQNVNMKLEFRRISRGEYVTAN